MIESKPVWQEMSSQVSKRNKAKILLVNKYIEKNYKAEEVCGIRIQTTWKTIVIKLAVYSFRILNC